MLHSALNCELSLSYCVTPLVIISDEGNRQAENGVETALKYLAQNNRANINKKSMVTLTGRSLPPLEPLAYFSLGKMILCPKANATCEVELSWFPARFPEPAVSRTIER